MIRNFTFLLYCACLLIAVAYPANQHQVSTMVIREEKATLVSPVEAKEAIDHEPAANPSEQIIVLPQLPTTEVYTPHAINDFKTGNPAEGIPLIKAPVPNASGNAVLNFNMKLPEGRLGLQPDLSVQYNNEGGVGWLGFGWSINTPSIGIETRWGAPRYDAAWETEMYTLNGELLAPVNNRSELVARAAEKRFYKRVESTFSRIIRHGNNPSNYWWEVTEKNGTRHSYGGREGSGVIDNAVLKDDQGHVAYWALVESRDVGDNFVRYEYTTVNDPGIAGSTVGGRQLYPSRIYYTGMGTTDGPYSVEFIRDRDLGESRRSDVTIDARFGFKMVSADLLRRVNVSLNGQLIRRYEYTYEQGAFDKTLLKSISEIDNAGVVFYTHQFEYFDDVNKNNYDPANPEQPWSIANDGIKGDIVNPIPGFTAEASAIATSKAQSVSGGVAVTVGSLAGGVWSKNTSVGGNFNYGEDNQEGLVSLVDIDGDGLPDKVIKKDGRLFYRPNLGGANRAFGELKPIIGVTDFSTSNSKNIGGGAEVEPPQGFIGYNHTTTSTTSKVYFSDFNGDGLMDIASDGRVYFNYIDEQTHHPTFITNSGLTPSPIFSGSIDNSFLAPDTGLQRRQELDFPLQDIVRVWQAPFDGTVTISAPIQLIDVPSQTGIANLKKDGVRASIQQGAVQLQSVLIDANDFTVKNFNVGNRTVTKGQNIYFRLQSRYNGQDDIVSWDPIIQYTTPVVQNSDVHHKTSNYYRASEDFIIHGKGSTGMAKGGQIIIDGTFEKNVTSDSVTIMINRDRNHVITTIFQRQYRPGELASGNLSYPGNLSVDSADQLYFIISSRSYIDRSALSWKPHYAYVAFNDATPVTNSNGQPTMQGYPVPDNSNFNSWVYAVPPDTVPVQDTVFVRPLISGNGNATGSLWFTIKGRDTVYTRHRIYMTAGANNAPMDSLVLIRRVNEPLFYEYATDSMEFALNLNRPEVFIFRDSIYMNGTDPDTTRITDTVFANLYANPSQYYFGPLFRGWGQFALKGDKGDGPINEDSLNLNELENFPDDPSQFTDTASLGNLPDPSKTGFVMLFPDAEKNYWVGYDTSVFVKGAIMSSARLWMYDVSVDSLMAGESAGAVHRISVTETDSYSAGLSTFGGSAAYSRATTTINLDMMDMNGDRYPDVLNDERIQYTLPHGGLGTTIISQAVGATESFGSSAGLSLGGSFIQASTGNNTQKAAVAANKTAEVSSGLSGSVNMNDDETITSWMDINGDGLTDRIHNNGIVQLNLGYTFGPGENWGLEGIDKARSYAYGAGMGVNIDAASFEAGIGLSRTEGDNKFGLNDVNGDGLPDQLFIEDSVNVVVRLNNGAGFGPRISWNRYHGITRNISTGESINGAFSIVIPIPIPFFPFKIVINPSASGGQGVSKQQKAVMDIDGDGYADMLDSDNDGDLSATSSKIGRTNMLRMVRSPLGGYFAMDYQRMGNTYDMPQSKWVLSGVEVFDGVPGDGVDTMRQRFEYEGGYHDRHEREFYGFRRVITRDLNTAENNIVYRSRIQEYSNSNYYTKGLLSREWVEDAAGRKFIQTDNEYTVTQVQDFVSFPALTQTSRRFFEGEAAAGVLGTTQFEYDAIGNVTRIIDAGDTKPEDMLFATITYHNIDALYIKNIPASIEVTTAEGVKRRRETTITGTGNIIRLRQFLGDGSFADTDIEYNAYSNVSKVTQPANYKGERMFQEYEYDDVVHQFVTRVTDAFGYTSTSTYDYRFGALTGTVSVNEERVQFTIDNRGRLTAVTGPYELAAGRPYTIAYNYNTNAAVPYAETRHYDPEQEGDIVLVSFVDGLGRVVQDKKQVSLFKGKNIPDELSMSVSGATLFDAFGRAASIWYPITEAMGGINYELNAGIGSLASSTTYDVLDRTTKTVLADGSETNIGYRIEDGLFSMTTTDALGSIKEILSDVRGRKRFFKETGPAGVITTRFDYNPLNELLKVIDHSGNAYTATWDNLGRRTSVDHPDAGRTDFIYDLAGNLLKKITPQIRKEIPNGGAIQYQYEFDRLTDIDYPRNYQNKVTFKYGAAGTGRKAGRLILQQDASGGQEFFYGLQGEIVKTIRTVLVSPIFAITYVSEQEFDSWNRIRKMIYADGEEVTYHYNRGGKLSTMEGRKQGHVYKYVDQAGYDLFEERVYLRYGNGAQIEYKYDSVRRRLTQLQARTMSGKSLMNNSYTYDAVSNVLSIVNNGTSTLNYNYDNLYRLDSANGEYGNSNFGVKLSYDNLHNIVQKRMTSTGSTYDNAYTYDASHPHHASQIGDRTYKHDANGNQLGYGDIENFFDEENRLMGVINKGVLSQYTYDADGLRVVKSSGGMQSIWVNGAPAGTVKHNDNYTIDVDPYLSCKAATFTKHYYIDDQRIASKLGHGRFTNINFPKPGLTAGGVDYTKRAGLIEKARQEYYASLGVSPGPPTDKNFWARPENSGIPAPVYVDTGATSVPPGWPGNTTPPPDGPPVFVSPIPSNDSVHAGYGFRDPGQLYEVSQFFFHPDQEGSTNFMTQVQGEMSLHAEYSPFGEVFSMERIGSFATPYLFNGKSFDEETGYYYYGNRYYDPVLSQWLSIVDPMGDDYPNDRSGGYVNMALLMNVGQTYASMVNSAIGGDGAGELSVAEPYVHKSSGGGDKGDKGNKGKGGENKSTNKMLGRGNNAKGNANGQGAGNMHKRGFRQRGLQNNGMFFSHQKQRKREAANKPVQQIKTRPRR